MREMEQKEGCGGIELNRDGRSDERDKRRDADDAF